MDDYRSGEKGIGRKPSAEKAATKAAKKIAGIEREESQEEDSSEDDEDEDCDGESKKGRMMLMARIEKSKADAKAKSKSKKNASTASAAKKATAPAEPRATMKRPAAVVEESLSKFPRVDLKNRCTGEVAGFTRPRAV